MVKINKQQYSCKLSPKKAEPELKVVGSSLLVARNVAKFITQPLKELKATNLFNTIFIPMDAISIAKKVRKMQKGNRIDSSLAIGVKFSGILKNTADMLGGLSALNVGGEQLVLASNALLGAGCALSVLGIIVNVQSYHKTKEFVNKIDERSGIEVADNLRIKDVNVRAKIEKIWKQNPVTDVEKKLKTLVKERYSQKIRSIKLAVLICVISIVAISIVLAGVATPAGWGLLITLGIFSIAKYCYDKHTYTKFKQKINQLNIS